MVRRSVAASYDVLRRWGFRRRDISRAVTVVSIWNQLANFAYPVIAVFLLTLFGGVLGLLLGATGCAILGQALGWQVTVPIGALALAPAISIAVGVFFGFYPARRASRLDPIQALRHE